MINAQLAVGDPLKYPEFDGNVKTMEARGHWMDAAVSPANAGYHYNRSAETFMLVGDSLGRAMIDLLGTTSDYDDWAALYSSADLSDPDADFDKDGLTNNKERIWGLDPTSASSVNPYAVPLDASGTFSYTRRNPILSGLSYSVWTSSDLQEWTKAGDADAAQVAGPPDLMDVETVEVTLGAGLRSEPRLFVRIQAADPQPDRDSSRRTRF